MTAEIKKGKYVYYHCSFSKQRCRRTYVREEILDGAFLNALKSIKMEGELLDWVLKIFRESHADKRAYHDKVTGDINRKLDTIKKRMESAYIDCLDQRIDVETHDRLRAKWIKERNELEDSLASHQRADDLYIENAAQLLELSQTCVDSYQSQPLLERRKLLNFVVSNSHWELRREELRKLQIEVPECYGSSRLMVECCA